MGLISRVPSRTYRSLKKKKKQPNIMSFVNPEDFQHILRVQNTNIDGNIKVTHAITSIRGMGRRFTDLVLKKAEIDRSKRAGQLTSNNLDNKLREDIERMKKIRLHRGIRHWWGYPVKGQKTKTSGRHGRTCGVLRKK